MLAMPSKQKNDFRLYRKQLEIIDKYVRSVGLTSPRPKYFGEEFEKARAMIADLPVGRELSNSDIQEILATPIALARHRNILDSAGQEEKALNDAYLEVVNFLQSLPRRYEVAVSIPCIPYWGDYEIELAEGVFLRSNRLPPAEKPKDAKAVLADLFGEPENSDYIFGRVSLVFIVEGYFGGSLNCHSGSLVLSKLKQVLFLLGLSESIAFRYNTGPAVHLDVLDFCSKETTSLELPDLISKHISGLQINAANFKISAVGVTLPEGEMRTPDNDAERIEALKQVFSIVMRFFAAESSVGFSRIAAGIDWYQESKFTVDHNLSFIAACIGLESFLGEEDGGLSDMTQRLADRYSFMLGKNREMRESLRSKFLQVYKIRGSIVHARLSGVEPRQRHQLGEVRRMLMDVIRHELAPLGVF